MFLSSTKSIVHLGLLGTLLVLGFLLPGLVQAAEVQVVPASGTYALGQTFTATVMVTPGEASANAVDATLEFDPSILSVVSVNKDDSDFTRWTTEPIFSNSLGTITFGGVSEAPFTASVNLVSITFRTLAPGDGDLSVADASVYATDGLRTDVFTGSESAVFTVSSDAEVVDESEEEPVITAVDMPVVHSEEFSDPEVWYGVSTGTFTWRLPAGTEAVAVEITTDADNRPNNNPEAIYETPISRFSITSDIVTEGVQYFSLRFRDEEGWGDEILNRKLLIDTVSPESFAVETTIENSEGFPTLHFEAVDFTSGIVGYEISIPNQEAVMLSASDVKSGYTLSKLEDGTYPITVIAYDRAGNFRPSEIKVTVTAGWTSTNANSNQFTAGSILDSIPNLSIYILATLIILLLIHSHFERKRIRLKEAKLARETHEIQSQTEKIFSALRDEIYDQINTITKRKRLSKAEKEAVEGLHQAIEVSESLIEKEINDVKKVLK